MPALCDLGLDGNPNRAPGNDIARGATTDHGPSDRPQREIAAVPRKTFISMDTQEGQKEIFELVHSWSNIHVRRRDPCYRIPIGGGAVRLDPSATFTSEADGAHTLLFRELVQHRDDRDAVDRRVTGSA